MQLGVRAITHCLWFSVIIAAIYVICSDYSPVCVILWYLVGAKKAFAFFSLIVNLQKRKHLFSPKRMRRWTFFPYIFLYRSYILVLYIFFSTRHNLFREFTLLPQPLHCTITPATKSSDNQYSHALKKAVNRLGNWRPCSVASGERWWMLYIMHDCCID